MRDMGTEHSIGPLTTPTWIRFKKFKVSLEEKLQQKVTNEEAIQTLLDIAEKQIEKKEV